MNLVGKIFIVLIFVMSVLFMGFAVAIYASHTNWRDVVKAPETGLEAQLDKETAKSDKLASERDRLEKERNAQEEAFKVVVAELRTKASELKTEQAATKQDLMDSNQDLRDRSAALAAAHSNLKDLRDEVVGLRGEIRKEQEAKDAAFSEVVEKTDQLHDVANELKTLQARNKDLAEDYASALEVLRIKGLKPIPAVYAGEAAKVDGLVLAVRNTGLIEVSIGKDDGLLTGHTLEVYRISDSMSTYLGKVEVTQVEPDKAACKILPEFRKGTIQRGDRVASKLK